MNDNMDMEKGGVKKDTGKPRMDLLPFDSLVAISEVLSVGAEKYDDHNWLKGMRWGRVFGSMLRHLAAWATGEDRDKETGLLHLSHAGCNVLFLLAYQLRGIGKDDRAKVPLFIACNIYK